MTYENISLVGFDLDGTILDTVPYKLAQNQHLARQFGRNISLEESRRIWNESSGFADLMKNICGTSDMSVVMPIVKRDYNLPEFQKRLFPFTRIFLEGLARQSFRSALITNATQEVLDLDAETFEIASFENYFHLVQAGDHSEYKKPDPRVFDQVLGHFGVAATQTVYIGDEIKDAHAALDAGIYFIGVETGLATSDEFKEFDVPVVPSLPQALKLLNSST